MSYDPRADRLALERLAEQCTSFSPTVGLEPAERPESLFLEVAGCAPCFGGEARLAQRLVQTLTEQGLVGCGVVADTIGAAWGVSHYGLGEGARRVGKTPVPQKPAWRVVPPGRTAEALAELPVAALRLPGEIVDALRELGIVRIAALEALPRASLAARFGAGLVDRLDQAFGRLEEVVSPHRPVALPAVRWDFEHPLEHAGVLESILRTLVERLTQPLAGRQGILRMECRLEREAGLVDAGSAPSCPPPRHVEEVVVELCQPTASPGHLFDLLRLRLEQDLARAGGARGRGPPARRVWRAASASPITAVELEATAVALVERSQQTLFDDPQGQLDAGAWNDLVDRLSSRLGREAVVRAELTFEVQPEWAYHETPWVEKGAKGTKGAPKRRSRRTLPRGTFRTAARSGEGNGLPRPVARTVEPAPGSAETPRGPAWRPLVLQPQPAAIRVLALAPEGPPLRLEHEGRTYTVGRWWGPERIETGWWRRAASGSTSTDIQRDYYRIETTTGLRWWIFRRRRDGAWFLHGVFE